MLILTRRPGETLIIETPAGEQIRVTVTDIKGNQVRIGTEAPDDIAIALAFAESSVCSGLLAIKGPLPSL